MLPTERISYSPITERPALKLPDGKRMAVWVIVNVEEWDANQPMPRTVLTPPAGGSPSPADGLTTIGPFGRATTATSTMWCWQ